MLYCTAFLLGEKMNGKKCYILDFDGTVTALDTLVVAFDKYCIVDWRELENEMRAGRKERHQTLVDEVESMKDISGKSQETLPV